MKQYRFHRFLLTIALLSAAVLFLRLPIHADSGVSGVWQSGSGGAKIKAAQYKSGLYHLTLSASGRTLSVGKLRSGAAVKKTSWKKTKPQLWVARRNADGTVSFLSAKKKTLALSITNKGIRLQKKGRKPSMTFHKVDSSSAPHSGGITSAENGAKQNGWLRLNGTQLVNENGAPIVLRGMSSHGLQWFPQFTTSSAIGATAAYGANLFRIAMYTEENGYIPNKAAILEKLYEAADNAISRNMYVIIDWHILSDFNPKTHQAEAKTFFNKVSARYANTPNVLYEICNEPNGGTSWSDIASYANAVIPVIRKNSPNSIILVGTPTWSQEVDAAASAPLSYKNVMYTCHFYAGTHGQWLRDRITAALQKGAPIFISEWGTSAADGNGGVYKKETQEWLAFLERNKLSWANWSLCDKAETSAALRPGANVEDGITAAELSASGKIVFARLSS